MGWIMMIGAAGAATERIDVGVAVTDTMRRHPAMQPHPFAAASLSAYSFGKTATDGCA